MPLSNLGLEQLQFKKGEYIYKINEKPRFAYYVYTGSIKILSEKGYVLGTVEEGELFGEISAMFNHFHSVSAEAATECRLLVIEKDAFNEKVKSADPVVKAILRTLSGRLSDSNKTSEKLWEDLHFLCSLQESEKKES
tara:strand:- start:75 stop:488 length:414 start_codon:yes stop_codon:yes gene_type:complete